MTIRCYLQETQFKYNYMGRLKIKHGKIYCMQTLIKGKLEWLNMRKSRLHRQRKTTTV